MSFSTEVKKELSQHISHALHCKEAELGALISLSAEIRNNDNKKSIVIKTENEYCIDKILKLIKFIFQFEPEKHIRESHSKNDIFRVEISDENKVNEIIKSLKLEEEYDSIYCNNILIERACCKRAFLRGMFIAGGSINNPEKAYHFEIVCDTEKKAEQLLNVIKSFGVEAKYVVRKKYHVVYIKEGAAIVDCLNIMEAHVSLMNMENVRILKDIRNSINRQVNCDTANMNKTATAAVKQKEDIQLIEEKKGLRFLPDGLRQLAELRKREPELTLKELGERLDPPIGKSGVNHRLRKISEIADELRENK